jgi:hypothetical protein
MCFILAVAQFVRVVIVKVVIIAFVLVLCPRGISKPWSVSLDLVKTCWFSFVGSVSCT